MPSKLLKRTITVGILFHFSLIAISYASNWKRSTLADSILTSAQPYLLGLGFGTEMHSVEWSRAPAKEQPVRILVADSKSNDPPRILFDSRVSGQDRFKKRQLLQFVVTFLELYDEESATKLLTSIVTHANRSQPIQFDMIVVEQRTDQHGEYERLYQAIVVHEDGDEPKFLPILEPQRTMKGINSGLHSESQMEEERGA